MKSRNHIEVTLSETYRFSSVGEFKEFADLINLHESNAALMVQAKDLGLTHRYSACISIDAVIHERLAEMMHGYKLSSGLSDDESSDSDYVPEDEESEQESELESVSLRSSVSSYVDSASECDESDTESDVSDTSSLEGEVYYDIGGFVVEKEFSPVALEDSASLPDSERPSINPSALFASRSQSRASSTGSYASSTSSRRSSISSHDDWKVASPRG